MRHQGKQTPMAHYPFKIPYTGQSAVMAKTIIGWAWSWRRDTRIRCTQRLAGSVLFINKSSLAPLNIISRKAQLAVGPPQNLKDVLWCARKLHQCFNPIIWHSAVTFGVHYIHLEAPRIDDERAISVWVHEEVRAIRRQRWLISILIQVVNRL